MRIRLRRFAQSPDGTIGRLFVPHDAERHEFYTLEEEWAENRRGESRIPAGKYRCERTIYHRYGYETFEVTGVPNRTRILFHPGNTEEDTQGCILVGLGMGLLEVTDEETGKRRNKIAVHRSRVAFNEFMKMTAGLDEFELSVTDPEWGI